MSENPNILLTGTTDRIGCATARLLHKIAQFADYVQITADKGREPINS
jgi:hypothetical protein